MITELEALKEEYLIIKNIKDKTLEMTDFKKTVKYKLKLDKAINSIKVIIQALNEAEEYSGSISAARARIMKELDNLELIRETL